MDQARLRKICIIKIHITDTFPSETRDTKAKLVKIL